MGIGGAVVFDAGRVVLEEVGPGKGKSKGESSRFGCGAGADVSGCNCCWGGWLY